MDYKILLEPRLTQLDDSEKTFLISRGGTNIQYYPFVAQSFNSSNFVFNTPPPTPSTVLDRNIILEIDYEAKIVGTPGTENRLLVDNQFALRAHPFSSCVDTLTTNINGQNIAVQLSRMVHILSRYNSTAESRTTFGSMFPNSLDMYQTYQDGGANNSPLASYGNALPGSYQPRGAYPMTITGNIPGTDTNPEVTVTVSGKIFEFVDISPFYSKAQEGTAGLSNIQNLTFNFTMSNLARMFSMARGTKTISAVNVTFQNPKMYLGFITPPEGMSVPRTLNFAYNDYNYYTGSGTIDVVAGATATFQSNVLQLSQLPEKVYICVRRSQNSLNTAQTAISTTDTYLRINKVNINFSNRDGIQSATTLEGLYLQSQRNGCNMSYVEFSGKTNKINNTGNTNPQIGTVGSVVGLEFGKDIPLQGLDAVGMSGSWNIAFTIDAENVGDDVNAELAIVTSSQGILTLEHPGNAFTTLGIVTPEMVATAQNSDMDYDDHMRLYGGGPGGVRKFFRSRGPMLRELGKAVGKVVAPNLTQQLDGIVDSAQNVVRSAQQDARMLAQGSALQGGMRAGMRAGALQGGEIIPRSTLRTRAR